MTSPDFSFVVRLAAVLDKPLEWFTSGRLRPAEDVAGLASELRWLGVLDLRVSEDRPPGAFRRAEEVLALALRGDRPEPRVVDAVPYVLATREFDPPLLAAFATHLDRRVGRRLAWLCEVADVLARTTGFAPGRTPPGWVRGFWLLTDPPHQDDTPDSLGHPSDGPPPLLWRRWRISYAGTLDNFRSRAAELRAAAGRGGV